MELIKIEPDREKAKSLVKIATMRQNKISGFDPAKESPLITEAYYEICKEIITAILFCDGYKTLSHTDLIEYIKKYKELNEQEIHIIDSLRKKRNQIVYYGTIEETSYAKRNEKTIQEIIRKLKRIIEEKTKK
jgi:hypothetical protein